MIGVAEIRRIIPHRYPILLLDRVAAVRPGRDLTALKAVTCAEPCYAGVGEDAAPGAYAYPVSLLIESWAQAAVLLACWEQPNPDVTAGKVELAGAVDGVRLLHAALPGDVLEHRVRLVRAIAGTAIVEGETVTAAGTVMTVAHFLVAMRDLDVLRPPAGVPAAVAEEAP